VIKNTPAEVANWLRANLGIRPPGHPERSVLERLANDPRMEGLWDRNEAGDWQWQAQVKLIEHATFLAHPAVLSTLLKPPDKRTDLATAELALAGAAERFLEVFGEFPDDAARLWVGADEFTAEIDPEPLNYLVMRLQLFVSRARTEAEWRRRMFDQTPVLAIRKTAT
jgi:hypothetical protein